MSLFQMYLGYYSARSAFAINVSEREAGLSNDRKIFMLIWGQYVMLKQCIQCFFEMAIWTPGPHLNLG